MLEHGRPVRRATGDAHPQALDGQGPQLGGQPGRQLPHLDQRLVQAVEYERQTMRAGLPTHELGVPEDRGAQLGELREVAEVEVQDAVGGARDGRGGR